MLGIDNQSIRFKEHSLFNCLVPFFQEENRAALLTRCIKALLLSFDAKERPNLRCGGKCPRSTAASVLVRSRIAHAV